MYDAGSENLDSQSLWAYPISQVGLKVRRTLVTAITTLEGASWNYRDGQNQKTYWLGLSG